MGTTIETRITSTQAKDAIYKAHSISSSASKVNTIINSGEQTIVLLGDSITANEGSFGTDLINAYSPTGQFMWANAISGQKFDVLYIAGVGGNTSSQILSRVDSDVISRNPTHCSFMAGVNDAVTPAGEELIKSNIIAIYEKLNNAGIYSFIMTLTTRSYTEATDRNRQALRVNNWLVNYFKNKPNCEVIDFCSVLIDPSSTNGMAVNDYLIDTIHPSTDGAMLGGKLIAKHLSKFKNKVILPTSAADCWKYDSSSQNIYQNPLMLGNTSGKANNIQTINSNVTTVFSKEVRVDGFGENQVIQLSTTATGSSACTIRFVASRLGLVGETFQFQYEIEIDGSTTGFMHASGHLNIDNSSASRVFFGGENNSYVMKHIPADGLKLTCVTPPFTLTSNNTLMMYGGIILFFFGAGSGIFKIGRVAIKKI